MVRVIAILSSAMLCAASAAQVTSNPDTPEPIPGARAEAAERSASTVELLDRRMPEIHFDETPLETVLTYLGDRLGVNVIVRWDRLAALGIQRDAPVSLRVRNLRVSQVLWLILNDVGTVDASLAYRADGDLLMISTKEDFGQEMVTRVYDVSDLLVTRIRRPSFNFGREHTVPIGNNVAVAQGAVAVQPITEIYRSGGFLEGDDPLGTIDEDDNETEDPEEMMRQLVDVITATVEPDTWAVNGGRGTVVPFRGMLVVRNSPLVHQALGGAAEAPVGP